MATRVAGVRTGDRGIDKHGRTKSTFEPGVEIRAKVTILTDGVARQPDQVARPPARARRRTQPAAVCARHQGAVGGARRTPRRRQRASIRWAIRCGWTSSAAASSTRCPTTSCRVGFVAGLDYRDPMFDPHVVFQHFKRHPLVASLLEGGQLVRYGAKALPEGGWHTIPKLYAAGAMIAGDAAGFMNSVRLKGIHLAMRTGMLAAETAFEAVRNGDTSAAAMKAYDDRDPGGAVRRSSIRSATCTRLQLRARSLARRSPGCRWSREAGGSRIRCRRTPAGRGCRSWPSTTRTREPDPDSTVNPAKIDRQLTFDRLTNVHYSGTRHDEDQPSHLIVHDTEVCAPAAARNIGNPCIRFCPANVYEMVDAGGGAEEAADQRLELRPLQDLRHHGSVSDHRLGSARGRRRAAATKGM